MSEPLSLHTVSPGAHGRWGVEVSGMGVWEAAGLKAPRNESHRGLDQVQGTVRGHCRDAKQGQNRLISVEEPRVYIPGQEDAL